MRVIFTLGYIYISAVMIQESLRMVHFAYIHYSMSYGLIFWGNSNYSNLIFKIRKRIVRIIMKTRNKGSYHALFRQSNILALHSQYIFSLSMLIVKNLNIYKFNTAKHNTNTRQGSRLHSPTNKTAEVQKGVYYSEIRIFNNLPQSIRNLLSDIIKFKQLLICFVLLVHFIP
jgi:hypothetical protein